MNTRTCESIPCTPEFCAVLGTSRHQVRIDGVWYYAHITECAALVPFGTWLEVYPLSAIEGEREEEPAV